MNKIVAVLICLFSLTSSVAAPDNSRSRVPSAKEAQELLKVICKGSSIDANARSCTPCPSKVYGSNAASAEGMLLTSVMYGKFLSKNETNAILDVQDCEPHVNNFGGSVYLRWKGLTNWEFVRYDAGSRSNDCVKYAARAGHDVRICAGFYAQMGYTIQSFFFADDTRKSSSADWLVTITSNAGQCMDPKLNEFELVRYVSRDLNGDQRPDLRLQVTERHATLPVQGECSDAINWSAKKTLTLDFLFDGAKFVPTPATKPIVKYLEGFKA